MVNRNAEKRDIYHLHIELDREYEPICKRAKVNTISSSDIHALRYEGKKHLDIWSDGKLYPPVDPLTKSTPPFSNSTSLLKYLGDGVNGLLGYTYHLAGERDILSLNNHLLKQEKDSMVQALEENKEKILQLEKVIKEFRKKETSLGPRYRLKRLRNIETLKRGSGGCSKRIKAVRYMSLFLAYI